MDEVPIKYNPAGAQRRHRYLLLLLLLPPLLCALPVAHAATDPPLLQPFDPNVFVRRLKDRIVSISSHSPIAARLRANTSAHAPLRRAFTLFDSLHAVVAARRLANSSDACNLIANARWAVSYKKLTPRLQIGMPDLSCYSRVDVRRAARAGELDDAGGGGENTLRGAAGIVREAREVLFRGARGIEMPKGGNWSAAYRVEEGALREENQVCDVDNLAAYRVNGSWYVTADVTNHPPALPVADWKRQIIMELIPQSLTQSLKTIHPRMGNGTMEWSTTLMMMYGGKALTASSTTGGNFFDDPVSPAWQAHRQHRVAVQLAEDAITLSNIAILALPLVMNIVPFAFIAELSSVTMALYVIVTDIFSAVPLLLKGVELVRSAALSNEVVVSFHAGADTLGMIEVWVARCRGKTQFLRAGIAFIAIAVATMAVGLVLELWANRVMRRRRGRVAELAGKWGTPHTVEGPFGNAMLGQGWRSGLWTRRWRKRGRLPAGETNRATTTTTHGSDWDVAAPPGAGRASHGGDANVAPGEPDAHDGKAQPASPQYNAVTPKRSAAGGGGGANGHGFVVSGDVAWSQALWGDGDVEAGGPSAGRAPHRLHAMLPVTARKAR